MPTAESIRKSNLSQLLFCVGFCLVLLSLWFPFLPEWLTFIHMWRVELFSSLFLSGFLLIVLKWSGDGLAFRPSRPELYLLLLPVCLFIGWSLASALWAESWKSALHHGLVWSAYLVFYCTVRHWLQADGFYGKMMVAATGTLVLYALPAVAGYISILAYGGSNTLGIRFARFGEQVLAITPLLIVGVVYLRGRYRFAALAGLGMLSLLMICTLGRTNIALFAVAAVGGIAVVVLSGRPALSRRLFWPVAVLLVFPAVLYASTLFGSGPDAAPVVSRMSDQAALSDSNGFRKLMISVSLEMAAENPFTGIGADNFGMAVNNFRERHALSNPEDPNLAQSENELPERAHNEYLQILAELGGTGLIIFVWFMGGIGFLFWRSAREFRHLPPHAPAALMGLGLFLVSSIVSSYSFRLIQNGFVFFFVLAVAVTMILKQDPEKDRSKFIFSGARLRTAIYCGIATCLLLAAYSSLRVGSVVVATQADYQADFAIAEEGYRLAMRLDDENPIARNHYGMRLFHQGRYFEAVPLLTEAIDSGLATSTAFSYLASAEALAGNNSGAELAMRRASVLYPRSVFVLTRYSVILEANGKHDESKRIFDRAAGIDFRAANTWKALITQGAHRVSASIAYGADLVKVMDLKPQPAVYATVTQRLIEHPDEQKFSLMSVGGGDVVNHGRDAKINLR